MTVQEAKEIDIVDYLSGALHTPVKISGKNYWYISPLHSEKTSSFKVNRTLNRWYDFGMGKGGNLVDFGIIYYKCSVAELLQKLKGLANPVKNLPQIKKGIPGTEDSPTNILEIISIKEITSPPLASYLHSRKIPLVIALKYLKEIRYKVGGRIYYSLGFKNDAGGYELRSRNFKGSTTPKAISLFENGSKYLNVFEGFFNFLSFLILAEKTGPPTINFLVLNSTSFFEKTIPEMLKYDRVNLYLDNDKSGERCTQKAIEVNSPKFSDKRSLYSGYSDLNDLLVKIGSSQKHIPYPT